MFSFIRYPALLLALMVFAPLAQAQNIIRGPYLQQASPTQMVVRWRTDVASDSQVSFAENGGTPVTVSSATSTTEHSVKLTGLAADTFYNYTVGTTSAVLAGGDLATNGDGEHHFTTSPAGMKDTRIWVIGDSGTADANAAAVRDAYKGFTGARGTDVWLMLGDNAYNIGSDTEYQAAVFDMYPELLRQVPLWSTIGNHDAIDMAFNPPGAYTEIFEFPTAGEAGGVASGTEHYYSFDYGDIHFIVLDSSFNASYTTGSPMYTWLQSDLAANTSAWTIALWHHGPYTKGSHDSDVEIPHIALRENALPLLESAGIDLTLAGHSHSYERSVLVDGHYDVSSTLTPAMVLNGGDGRETGDGVYVKPGDAGTANEGAVHVVAGSSGKLENGPFGHPVMYTSQLTLGSLVIDVSGNRLDGAFLDAAGVVQDEFTIVKDPPQEVAIDVLPWSTANEVRPASSEGLPVAILGESGVFDAGDIDPVTVRFGIGEAQNVATPWLTDLGGDAEDDLLLAFDTMDTGIFCNDTEVSLTGQTAAGEAFIGTDTITTVDCTDGGCHP